MDKQNDAIHLTEDMTGSRFLIYSGKDGPQLDIRWQEDALWLSQAQMAELFGRDISTISCHIANILAEGELEEESNLQKMQIANSDKPIVLYSLDMVISVGYRVSSAQATF